MCNLYDIGPARRRRGGRWEESVAAVLSGLAKPWGIRKTDPAPVVRLEGGAPAASLMRWGFERPYNPAVNNARLERLDGPWAGAWRGRRRCLIPLSTWYEWHGPAGAKQTFAFEAPGGEWLWAAGLWEQGKSGVAFSMITRSAAPALAFVHDRMPALVAPDEFDAYLREADPRGLLSGDGTSVQVYRCHNPLRRAAGHRGPEPEETLPGF